MILIIGCLLAALGANMFALLKVYRSFQFLLQAVELQRGMNNQNFGTLLNLKIEVTALTARVTTVEEKLRGFDYNV